MCMVVAGSWYCGGIGLDVSPDVSGLFLSPSSLHFGKSAFTIHGASPGLGKNGEGPLSAVLEGAQDRTRAI